MADGLKPWNKKIEAILNSQAAHLVMSREYAPSIGAVIFYQDMFAR